MALRDQPYLPLYIQDIMTDEKLNECSAATHGIYIKGIMCLMHKSEKYGRILLKQKHKQTGDFAKDLAHQLVKHLPYELLEIEHAIRELLDEEVCHIEAGCLCQKRMIRDGEISLKRSQSGKKGVAARQKNKEEKSEFGKPNHEANTQANTENEYVIENENESEKKKEFPKRKKHKHRLHGEAGTIIMYLNELTDQTFDPDSHEIVLYVTNKFDDGYSFEDCKLVTELKVAQWIENAKMKTFLVPSTLFGDKFAQYLTEAKDAKRKGLTVNEVRGEPDLKTDLEQGLQHRVV